MSTCASGLQPSHNTAPAAGLAWLTAGLLSAGLAALAVAGYFARRSAFLRHYDRAGGGAGGRAQPRYWLHLLLGRGEPRPPQHPPRGGEHSDGEGQGLPGCFNELAEELEAFETPEPFTDPITLGLMHDPVVLSGTGQVYHYPSLRAWLSTGQRRCPKTNLPLLDVEVVRLPLLRHAVHAWMNLQCLPVPQPNPTVDDLAAADPRFPGWVADLRCGDVSRRGIQAAAKINDVLIEWGKDEAADEELKQHRVAAMEHVIDDLVWLLRHGDSYGQGVACAALSQYQQEEQRQWLAAVAAIPAAQLLNSPNDYARHSAARLLTLLARAHTHMPEVLCAAGAVPGLLAQLDLSRPFPYTRCSAASALSGLAVASGGGVREEIRRGGGVALLVALVLWEEEEQGQGVGPPDEQLDRFNKRDAAWALLELGLAEEELQGLGVTLAQLQAYRNCSQAWLHGKVVAPDLGYTPEELAQLRLEEEAAQPAAAAAREQDEAGQLDDEGPEEAAGQPDRPAVGEAGHRDGVGLLEEEAGQRDDEGPEEEAGQRDDEGPEEAAGQPDGPAVEAGHGDADRLLEEQAAPGGP